MDKPVVIFGAGDMGRAALEIFESNKVITYCFLDDDPELKGTEIDNVAVMGTTEDEEIISIIGKETEAFIALDDNKIRKSLVEQLKSKNKAVPVNAIHETSQISFSASLGHGNFINNRVVIGSGSKIGGFGIFNSGSVIDHNVTLGDFVQVGAGAVVGSGCQIGDEVFIGTGAILVPGIKIGKNARIGAGSVVVDHVKDNETVFGNPAVKIER